MIDGSRVGGVTGVMTTRKTRRMLEAETKFNGEPLETVIPRLLSANGGRMGVVCKLLGVSRHSLYLWCIRLDIPVGKPRGPHK